MQINYCNGILKFTKMNQNIHTLLYIEGKLKMQVYMNSGNGNQIDNLIGLNQDKKLIN